MTITEVRRRLPVGTEFTGEFLNPLRPDNPHIIARRKIVKQTASQMVSVFLEGAKLGEKIYLDWKGTKAREEDGKIFSR
jgi:hypothetical protein